METRVICPQCSQELFFKEASETELYEVTCPTCHYKFVVRPSDIRPCSEPQCGWEEHGEPRKTILSSMKKFTNKPRIAAFLLAVIGALGICTAILLYSSVADVLPGVTIVLSFLSSIHSDTFVLFLILLIFSFFALVGAVTAFKRRFFLFTLLCVILGMCSIGLYIGPILAIIVLWLLVTSRDEFEDASQGKVF